ncbi:MAG: hypothetical protein NWE92_13925 [Candidatus Bathyarchaeota archaeon]|nr:hypothetical protein [Candidatus Bathyarchaeota archaeon]
MKASELVEELTVFGLSVNQAKVYLSILRSKGSRISAVADDTQIHPQDICKILPKLEKMGLITKTTERPFFITSIPSAKALPRIIQAEQQIANNKINRMKAITDLLQTIEGTQTKDENHPQSDIQATFLVTDNTVNNTLDQAFEKARVRCDCVLNFELIRRRMPLLINRYRTLVSHKVKTRLLIDETNNTESTEKVLEQIVPSMGNFTLKQGGKITVKPYVIIDDKEVFISTQRKTAGHFPCILKTNSKNIIAIYQHNFESAWKKGKPIILKR